jgi:hypothetical protein
MKLVLNPMPALRTQAKRYANESANRLAGVEQHRDQAHMRKREVARWAVDGQSVPPEFEEEAALRGMTTLAFAQDILARAASEIDARELRRQKLHMAIEAAATPAEIDVIMQEAGLIMWPGSSNPQSLPGVTNYG